MVCLFPVERPIYSQVERINLQVALTERKPIKSDGGGIADRDEVTSQQPARRSRKPARRSSSLSDDPHWQTSVTAIRLLQ